MARKRKPKLSDTDRENMLAQAKTLLKENNQMKSGINPNCDDYEALSAFYDATRQLAIDLSGDPNYFDHSGSGLQGLGSSRER